MELPLHVTLSLVSFERWGIDYIGVVHPHSSTGKAYIVVATEYLTKRAEARAVRSGKGGGQSAHFCLKTLSRGLSVRKFW